MRSIRKFLRQRPEGTLYHYTDAAGLLGIFTGKEIWASDPLHLNDARELRHAQSVLLSEFAARAADPTTPQEDRSIYLRASEYHRRPRPPYVAMTHVVSFSVNGDQLSQWRAYCPRGNGFSIGFALSDLKRALEPSRYRLVKCVYDRDEQQELIKALCDYTIRGLRRVARLKEKEELVEPRRRRGLGLRLELRLGEFAVRVMLAIKHHSFREEQEWRLVGECDQPRFRSGRFGIMPYSAIPLCGADQKPSFEKIYVGPNAEPGLATDAVHRFLSAYAETNPHDRIVNSEVPYRH